MRRRRHFDGAADRPAGTLAAATTGDGILVAGTRTHLHIGDRAVRWDQVQGADWDTEAEVLRVTEVGTWGAERPVHDLALPDPGRLLEFVRERITASIVLQRHVPIHDGAGVFVIARRRLGTDAPLQWVYEFQAGIDPDDPDVRRAAAAALVVAQEELGVE